MQKYRRLHPDRIKVTQSRSYRKHSEQRKAAARAYRKANPEKVRSWSRAGARRWRNRNPEGFKKVQAAYKQRNREKYLAMHREHERSRRKRHTLRLKEEDRVRHANRRAAAGFCTVAKWMARVAFHGWRCRYCRVSLSPASLVQDHAIALSRGGTNWPANLVPACKKCNTKKREKSIFEFLKFLAQSVAPEDVAAAA